MDALLTSVPNFEEQKKGRAEASIAESDGRITFIVKPSNELLVFVAVENCY